MAHRNRVRVEQLSGSDEVGWFHPSFARNSRLTVFWRVWRTERNLAAARGPKLAKNTQKWAFWAKRRLTKFDRMLYADPVNPVWVPCDPGTLSPFWRGQGGRFIGWGPVLSVLELKILGLPKIEKNLEIFILHCDFKKCLFVEEGAFFLLFRPLVQPTGAVRTEKT